MHMYIRDKMRSASQQARDEAEAAEKRRREEDQNQIHQRRSNEALAEDRRRAALRKEERLKNLTIADLADMPPAEIAKLHDEGKLQHLMGIQAASTQRPADAGMLEQEQDTEANENEPDEGQEEPITAAELATMTPRELVEAYDNGRLAELLTKPRN